MTLLSAIISLTKKIKIERLQICQIEKCMILTTATWFLVVGNKKDYGKTRICIKWQATHIYSLPAPFVDKHI